MTQTATVQYVIRASHLAYDAYAKKHSTPVPQAAIEAWHKTYREALDAADFDEAEEAMYLYGTGRM